MSSADAIALAIVASSLTALVGWQVIKTIAFYLGRAYSNDVASE